MSDGIYEPRRLPTDRQALTYWPYRGDLAQQLNIISARYNALATEMERLRDLVGEGRQDTVTEGHASVTVSQETYDAMVRSLDEEPKVDPALVERLRQARELRKGEER